MNLIADELAALGVAANAARLIAADVATSYLDDTADHGDDGLDDLGGDARAAAAMITITLVRVTRADGGPACPDVARPAAFAAHAVRLGVATLA